jgi:hypothetical protein
MSACSLSLFLGLAPGISYQSWRGRYEFVDSTFLVTEGETGNPVELYLKASLSQLVPIVPFGHDVLAVVKGCAALIVVAAEHFACIRTLYMISRLNQRSKQSAYAADHTSCGGVKSLRASVDAHDRHEVAWETEYAHGA